MTVQRFKVRTFLFGAGADETVWGVSLANAIGFGLAVGGVTYMDSTYTNPVYGQRSYALGYNVLLLCLPVFYLTYRFGCASKSIFPSRYGEWGKVGTVSMFTLLIPVLMGLLLSYNFLPEFPHLGVLQLTFVAGAFNSSVMYLHGLRSIFDFSYTKDSTRSIVARVEMLKLHHETWYDALKLLVTIFLAFASAYIFYGYEITLRLTMEPGSAFALARFGRYFVLYLALVFILGIVGELLKGMLEIQRQLVNIKSEGSPRCLDQLNARV